MTTAATDVIRKQQMLRAPLARVWSAISDSQQFGRWFGAELDGPFTPGARLIGRIVPTTVDPEVAKMQEPYTGKEMVLLVDRVEPMRLLSFRWHPGIVERGQWDTEPTTLVEFRLEEVPGGTMLTVTESGFDGIPLERRAKAFAENAEGWTHQMQLIAKYLGVA
jgi:uncharacterized protein YndB with AHSA1/START domain